MDDQFLLRPKRIEAMCKGINDNNLEIQWGCEGRVDSKCMQLFPAMANANCRTMMFGIESGSQKILDRLKKGQTLEEIETEREEKGETWFFSERQYGSFSRSFRLPTTFVMILFSM